MISRKKKNLQKKKIVKKENSFSGKRSQEILISAYISGYESRHQAIMKYKLNYIVW